MGLRVSIVGEPDVFVAIANIGGLRPRVPGKPTNGLYDGWKDAIQGEARLLVRNEGLAPDDMREQLKDCGFNFETVSDMYEAIARAVDSRSSIRSAIEDVDRERKEMKKQERTKAKEAKAANKPMKRGDLIMPTFTNVVLRTKKTTGKTKLYVVGLAEKGEAFLFKVKGAPKSGFKTADEAVEFAKKNATVDGLKELVGPSLPYKLEATDRVVVGKPLPLPAPEAKKEAKPEPKPEPKAETKPEAKKDAPKPEAKKDAPKKEAPKAKAAAAAAPKK